MACAHEHVLCLCICTDISVASGGGCVRTPVCNRTTLLKAFEQYKATGIGGGGAVTVDTLPFSLTSPFLPISHLGFLAASSSTSRFCISWDRSLGPTKGQWSGSPGLGSLAYALECFLALTASPFPPVKRAGNKQNPQREVVVAQYLSRRSASMCPTQWLAVVRGSTSSQDGKPTQLLITPSVAGETEELTFEFVCI